MQGAHSSVVSRLDSNAPTRKGNCLPCEINNLEQLSRATIESEPLEKRITLLHALEICF